MPKFKIDPSNPNTYARMRKDGRGLGVGKDYKPWLTVRDLSSRGVSSRLTGWRSGNRLVQIFSNLERDFFYRLEWDQNVTDIREQFPMELAITRAIAEENGWRHPTGRKTGLPMPMTTDFLVTRDVAGTVELTAYYVKPFEEIELLSSSRPRHVKNNLVKLRIEQEYWRQQGVRHALVTERDFDRVISMNVSQVHNRRKILSIAPLDADAVNVLDTSLLPLVRQGLPLSTICADYDKRQGFPDGTSLKGVFHLIATWRWPVDFRVEMDPTLPLKLL